MRNGLHAKSPGIVGKLLRVLGLMLLFVLLFLIGTILALALAYVTWKVWVA